MADSFIVQRIPNAILLVVGLTAIQFAHYKYEELDYTFPEVNTYERRLFFAFRCLAVSLVPICISILDVVRCRFLTQAINPLAGHEDKVLTAQKILQNTIEQFLIHAFTLVAYASILPNDHLKAVPCLVALFVASRLCFFLGYHIHPTARAFGFVTTSVPTVFALGNVLGYLYKVGPGKFNE